MKIYVAALYSMIKEANAAASLLRDAGHEITAQWLNGDETNKSLQDAAVMDIDDVARAEALVLITLPFGTMYKGGGRHVEFGYALGLGKKVYVVGDYETIFCHLPNVIVYSTVGSLINFLETEKSDHV